MLHDGAMQHARRGLPLGLSVNKRGRCHDGILVFVQFQFNMVLDSLGIEIEY